jgi:hypothetical protein
MLLLEIFCVSMISITSSNMKGERGATILKNLDKNTIWMMIIR